MPAIYKLRIDTIRQTFAQN